MTRATPSGGAAGPRRWRRAYERVSSRRVGLAARGAVAAAFAVALVALPSCTDPDSDRTDDVGTDRPIDLDREAVDEERADILELTHLSADRRRIVDADGRQVLLRGANVNALGEYAQGVESDPPTAAVTKDDWMAMAARGMTATRLVLSWSRLEPERGRIDDAYLDEIAAAVDAANDVGIYVVLDVHQDAWGMASETPADAACPEGTAPARGWDGAPAWATITDGATTCRPPGSNREEAPAVQRAFANFYANTDGIADRLTAVWAALAERFGDTPGVAGYNLLNEPNMVAPFERNQEMYSRWIARTVDAIRATETEAGTPSKLVFVEPLQLYPVPNNGLVPDIVAADQIVFAPHNYAESISSVLTLEQTFAILRFGADELDAPLWIGEYGFWDTSADTLAVARRYAAEEDRQVVGGTWWQWRQTCGDPHSIRDRNRPATDDAVHLITRHCEPGADDHDTDAGPTDEFLDILGRSYPMRAPGTIAELTSDIDSGRIRVRGVDARAGQTLVVWIPAAPDATTPRVTTSDGLGGVRIQPVDGGHLVTAEAAGGAWRLDAGG